MKLSVDLISSMIPVLHLTDTGANGLALMEDFKVSHLPVVDNGFYVGLVSETNILDVNDMNLPLSGYSMSFDPIFVLPDMPIFDLVTFTSIHKHSIIVVANKERQYIGAIPMTNLIKRMAESPSFSAPGGIIVLAMGVNDYSLSQIAQIVESNNSKILCLYICNLPESLDIEVVIKVNTTDITSIVATFNRYSYNIAGIYDAVDNSVDLLDERFDQLVRFLNT